MGVASAVMAGVGFLGDIFGSVGQASSLGQQASEQLFQSQLDAVRMGGERLQNSYALLDTTKQFDLQSSYNMVAAAANGTFGASFSALQAADYMNFKEDVSDRYALSDSIAKQTSDLIKARGAASAKGLRQSVPLTVAGTLLGGAANQASSAANLYVGFGNFKKSGSLGKLIK